jgi:carbon-monoxide dehydrogenase medium subunit
VDQAVALLAEHGESAKLLAGGHSLLPIMKLRLAEPELLIDSGRIEALKGIHDDGNEIVVRALATHHEIATSPLLHRLTPLLAGVAARVGDRQVRNRGTIGGALAHADAAADYPAAILALEATIVARGPQGDRRIPAGAFFIDFLTTALQPNEILTEIRITPPSSGHGWSYQKLANQASGYALVGVGAVVTLEGRLCSDIGIGVTGAAAVAWRASAVETMLRGKPLDPEGVGAAAAFVMDGVEPLDDLHGSADYRRRVTHGLTRRAILQAAHGAGGTK